MATFMETGAYRGADDPEDSTHSGSLDPRLSDNIEPDTRNLSTMLCPLAGVLALGAVGIVAVSGQFPWFVAPLALFAFFSICFLRG
jgi:hypothetical protein